MDVGVGFEHIGSSEPCVGWLVGENMEKGEDEDDDTE